MAVMSDQLRQAREAERKAQAELAQIHEAAKAETAQAVRDLIEDSGLDVAEVLPLLHGPSRPAELRGFKTYILRRDRSKAYTRGRWPTWLREAIADAGMDPADPTSWGRFAAEHMEVAP